MISGESSLIYIVRIDFGSAAKFRSEISKSKTVQPSLGLPRLLFELASNLDRLE
jgi:hypothetical protein